MTDSEEYIEFCSDIRELKGQHDLTDTVIPSKPSLSEKPVQQELWPSEEGCSQSMVTCLWEGAGGINVLTFFSCCPVSCHLSSWPNPKRS